MKTNVNTPVPQVKIITMTEDELAAKMEDFRRQIMSDLKTLLAGQGYPPKRMPPPENPFHPDDYPRTEAYFVSAKDLSQKFGVGITTIWNWSRAGKLPQPIKLAEKGCTRWKWTEVVEAMGKLNQDCA